MVEKSLDKKLAEIHTDPSGSGAFIIADAKDADMAFGITATEIFSEYHHGEVQFKSIHEYGTDAAGGAAGIGGYHAHVRQFQ